MNFIFAHPVKALLYVIGSLVGSYIIIVIVGTLGVLALALYASKGKSARAMRLRRKLLEWQFEREMLSNASPETIAKHGGKKGYKQLIRASIVIHGMHERLDEITATREAVRQQTATLNVADTITGETDKLLKKYNQGA